MKRAMRWAVASALLLGVAACGPSTRGTSTARPGLDVITAEQIDVASHANAFLLVQALRPQWLRTRGPSTTGAREVVQVYVDGSHLGGPDYLRQIASVSVARIEYLDGLEASQRWGMNHGGGAIVVTTRGR